MIIKIVFQVNISFSSLKQYVWDIRHEWLLTESIADICFKSYVEYFNIFNKQIYLSIIVPML